jgi:hypothetical protein
MKKQMKKLALAKETLRNLDTHNLKHVGGLAIPFSESCACPIATDGSCYCGPTHTCSAHSCQVCFPITVGNGD